MVDKLKIIVIGLALLLAISLFLVFGIQASKSRLLRDYNSTRQKLTQENKALTDKLETVLAEKRSLEDRLSVIQEDLERMSSEKDQLQQRLELVNKERQELLDKAKLFVQVEQDGGSLKNENQALREQIASLEKEKRTLEDNLKAVEQDKESFKQKITEAKQILKKESAPPPPSEYEMEQELSVTQEAGVWSVDLPPIVVSPQVTSGAKSSFSLTGEILNVNTEYAFVVINLGEQMGVRQGMTFDVFRGDRYLGKVGVIQLRQRIAACDIIQADMLFKTGDIVRY
jgi:myosin heavy subunit